MDRVLNGGSVPATPARDERVSLVDLLDRLLAGGVVIAGDITISIADVDLVRISLRAIIASIRPEMTRMADGVEVLRRPARPVEPAVSWLGSAR
jgi:hypothetical protein